VTDGFRPEDGHLMPKELNLCFHFFSENFLHSLLNTRIVEQICHRKIE
jgi:hypothetical protein